MQVTFQLTADDCRDGFVVWRNLKSWRRWGIRAGAAFFGFGFVVFVLQFFVGSATLISVVPELVLSAAFLVLIWATPSISGRRQFRNMPGAHDPTTMEASDSGLRVRSIHSDSNSAWSAYIAWGENKSVFVILPQPRIFVPIPKRAFTDQQQTEFRELLRRNILPQKK